MPGGCTMAVQFKGSKGSPVAITLAVSSKTGGAVKATFVWQNITDPTSPTVIEDDEALASREAGTAACRAVALTNVVVSAV